MPKRIVIIPEFASFHLLKCWIPNMIQTLSPDMIIINSGLFPRGPENKGHVDTEEFRKKWCYGEYNFGFDYDDTLNFVTSLAKDRYDGDLSIPRIECRAIQYDDSDVNKCFIKAITDPLDCLVSAGDIIIPLEPDAFLMEADKETINLEVSKLKAGEGLSCKWVDFLETQYYTEAINIVQPKYRRFCYCFDNMENYKKAIDGFTLQQYPLLRKTDAFFIRHYCWFCPPPYKQLRFELIHRSDPNYWKEFEKGLQMIKFESELHISQSTWGDRRESWPSDKIVIRPSRQDEGRYAQIIDIQHPKAIQSHPNFVK